VVVECISLVKAILGEVETAAILRCRTRPDTESPAQIKVIKILIETAESFMYFPRYCEGQSKDLVRVDVKADS
jgi:hypothetical protein